MLEQPLGLNVENIKQNKSMVKFDSFCHSQTESTPNLKNELLFGTGFSTGFEKSKVPIDKMYWFCLSSHKKFKPPNFRIFPSKFRTIKYLRFSISIMQSQDINIPAATDLL